ncbi:hypothetical protein BCR43DRAFT_491530 [Syncephalastrum racemosum]|uniref:Protein Abitram n=1 Tax=Syncephalastrum racemosum TaxID=13706 RepID=A0A1X2HC27_SYNRA|nr:hypothetical protein BCR43DRAFT_491530 [Syncephalastrum racemosum]
MQDEHGYDLSQHVKRVAEWTTQDDGRGFVNQYFDLYYHWEKDDLATATYVRRTPSKVCILGVAPTHTVAQSDCIQAIEPMKKKKDKITNNPVIAQITLGNGQRVPVRARFRGHFLELNPRLQEDPDLLRRDPFFEGYLAVIKGFDDPPQMAFAGFKSRQQYEQRVNGTLPDQVVDNEPFKEPEPPHDNDHSNDNGINTTDIDNDNPMELDDTPKKGSNYCLLM